MACANGSAAKSHPADRKITMIVDWGADDLRDEWSGSYEVCSFACLAALVHKWEAAHDGKVLREGTS